MKIKLCHNYDDIISLDNLLQAWKEFVRGKKDKRDVLIFSSHLMDNKAKAGPARGCSIVSRISGTWEWEEVIEVHNKC